MINHSRRIEARELVIIPKTMLNQLKGIKNLLILIQVKHIQRQIEVKEQAITQRMILILFIGLKVKSLVALVILILVRQQSRP